MRKWKNLSEEMMYRIRRTNNEFLVRALNAEIFPQDDFYEHEGNIFWIVKKGKEDVGFFQATDCGDGVMFLSRCGLLESARGQGLHKRMIRTRERYARKHGFESIITYTVRDNISSSVNILKCGYSLYIPEYQYVGDEVLYFKKDLT